LKSDLSTHIEQHDVVTTSPFKPLQAETLARNVPAGSR